MLLTIEWSNALSLWLPFWPLEPFLPLLLLGLGIQILTKPSKYYINATIALRSRFE